jgi:hypothetical protein
MTDADRYHLFSEKIPNDEPALLEPIAAVFALCDEDDVVWATDLNHGGPVLLIAMLAPHGQDVRYIPGRVVHRASRLYRGGPTSGRTRAISHLEA